MNLKRFYDGFRLMFGPVSQKQVDGFDFLLQKISKDERWQDSRHVGYALATIYHETAHTMQPIREYGRGKGRPYGRRDAETGQYYYGRGYVQLTWRYNYQKAKDKLGVDFEIDPDLVMQPKYAYEIMAAGMFEGWFTSHKLSDHIDGFKCDYKNARKIINGLDKANLIAGYAEKFEYLYERNQ